MYTENDLSQVRAQIRKRAVILACAAGAMLIVTIVCAATRQEILTDIFSILTGVAVIFGYDFCIKPLRRYAVHIDNCLHGHTHSVDVTFRSLDPEISLVDGVRYHAVSAEELGNNETVDRLFYWDAEREWPCFAEGERLRIVYHDREIAAWERIV